MTDIGLKRQIQQGNGMQGGFTTQHQRKEAVNEFRRTHFIFGKHSTIHYSQARFDEMKGIGMQGGRQKQTNSIAKNQMTNFSIGTGLPKHQQYGTTYNTITGRARGWKTQKQTIGEVQAKKTSVQLGRGNAFGFVSTNSRLFPNKDSNLAI